MTPRAFIPAIGLFLGFAALLTATPVDTLILGDRSSEQGHHLESDHSEAFVGDHGLPARRLLPLPHVAWDGGSITFTLKVDPDKPNYFTAKFSGDETNVERLMLYADGKQIGYRHLGDVEQLDYGTSGPAYNGRFYYNTSPLPLSLTKGKTELRFEIRSSGKIWGYGNTWEKFQKDMTAPSKGIYRVYTHTDGCFVPPADEVQGDIPASPPVRREPGPEVLTQIEERVNREIDARLAPSSTPSQMQLQLLAKAYDVVWTHAYQNPRTIAQIIKGLDALYAAYVKNPDLARADPSTWNPEWFGLGICGQVISLRYEQLRADLDKQIPDGRGGDISRRQAYASMLLATRDWHRLHRRLYSNQTIINDLNGIYLPNRGLEVLDPAKALGEPEVRRYLYESVGLIPWTNSDPGGHQWDVAPGYMELTAKGLTKELGYVGSYGEVIDLVCEVYNATRPAPGLPGDAKIKDQLVKVALARSIFRYPSLDDQGNRAMRLEQVVGWRDYNYPGYVAYAQRASRDSSALQAAALTGDLRLIGYAKQMLTDNQFFASEVEAMNDDAQGLRTTIGRLETPDQYSLISSLPNSEYRLPMSQGRSDFVWSDEQDGVLAIKHGDEILYASLYWRARFGINDLARIHYITPAYDRVAVVREHTEFTPQGQDYVRPDYTNQGFGNGGLRYPGNLHSALAGEVLPIAKIPAEIPFKPGQENPYAGRGDFYVLRYGPYLIGMNMSADKTFSLAVPSDVRSAVNLGAGAGNVAPSSSLQISPRSTTVLLLEK